MVLPLFACHSATELQGGRALGFGVNEEAIEAYSAPVVTCNPGHTYAFPGDRLLLRGTIRGRPNEKVSWETSAGTIDASEVFTAPAETGAVIITAKATSDVRGKDSCIIEVIDEPLVRPGNGPGAALSVHTALGVPTAFEEEDLSNIPIIRDEYVLSYNATRKVANWAAWELNGRHFGGAVRSKSWRKDQTLGNDVPQATDKDYTNSGYDRGHLCPSGDRTRLDEVNSNTFFLTNALPQASNVNSGPWQDFEDYLQGLALDGKELFIVAGGLFDDDPPRIGRGVAVPSAVWKVAVIFDSISDRAPNANINTRVIAVLMPNDDGAVDRSDDWETFIVRVDDIEALIRLDLLSDLDPRLESWLESQIPLLP